MDRRHPDRQALGRLDWVVTLDLTREDRGPIYDMLALLDERCMRGRTVRVLVAGLRPVDVDDRIIPTLQEVRSRGVGLQFDGDLYVVGGWLRAVRGDAALFAEVERVLR